MVSDENDLKLEDISILRDFPDVFLNDLSGLPQKGRWMWTHSFHVRPHSISETRFYL